VDNVHTEGFGSGRTGGGLGRIGDVFREWRIRKAGMQFESHLGHVFPQVRDSFEPLTC
jgi:hypothetical protein